MEHTTERFYLQMVADLEASISKIVAHQQSVPKFPNCLDWAKHYFPHVFTAPWSPMHRWIGHCIDDILPQRRQQIDHEGPRGNAKSSFWSFLLPMKAVCDGSEKYIILSADTLAQALKYIEQIKQELTENVKLAEAYPQACGQGPVWQGARIVTKNGICIEAISSGQKIRGRKFYSWRPGLIVVDDPEGDDAAYSPAMRERIWNWFSKGVSKAIGPDGNIVVAGTRIHPECLTARLAILPGWTRPSPKDTGTAHDFFVSMIEWPTNMDLWHKWEGILSDLSDTERTETARKFYEANKDAMTVGAKVLWEEWETLYSLMLTKCTTGDAAFASEKQNHPRDPSKCEWEESCFQGDIFFDEWPKDPLCRVMALDPSKGIQDDSRDFQAIIELAVARDGTLYVDADINRRPLKALVEVFVDRIGVFRPDIAVAESNQFQSLLLPEFQDAAIAKRILAPIEGMENMDKKVMRIRRLGPYVTRQRIRFAKRSRGINILLGMLKDFPTGTHDDGPDALEMAVRRAAALLGAPGSVRNPF